MKIRLNPIVKKDMQVAARSMRMSWGLFAYEGVLMLAFMLALTIIQAESKSYYSNNIYSYLIYLFPILAGVQAGIVALIVPILTASSISGEKERQTFDIMLTTCMSPFSIVFGKVTSAVIRILFYVAGSTPIMALAFVVGGLSWLDLFTFVLTIILLSVFSGSIGILCSAICRRAITAVILSFVFYFGIYGLTFIPSLLHLVFGNSKMGESLLLWLFNPIIFYEEYFTQVMMGETVLSDASFSRQDVGPITYLLANGHIWIYVSAICILALSFLFMWAAAWRVNPLHSSGGRKPKKTSVGA